MNDGERLREIIRVQSEIAGASHTVPEVMQLIVDRAQELAGATGAAIELVEGREVVVATAAGNLVAQLGLRADVDATLSGLTVQLNEVLVSDDCDRDERVDGESCRALGVRSMICVPLRDEGAPVGVLQVASYRPHGFGPHDVETLTLLSEMVSVALGQARLIEQRLHESTHDLLTGLANRRNYEEVLPVEVARASRYGPTLSLVLLDLDGFSAINDTFGRERGDAILATIGSRLQNTRQTDMAFRTGGDEFALLLPGTDVNGAGVVVWRLYKEITSVDPDVGVGATFGVSELLKGESAEAFHARAEAALTEARSIQNQRLRVTFSGPSDLPRVRV